MSYLIITGRIIVLSYYKTDERYRAVTSYGIRVIIPFSVLYTDVHRTGSRRCAALTGIFVPVGRVVRDPPAADEPAGFLFPIL